MTIGPREACAASEASRNTHAVDSASRRAAAVAASLSRSRAAAAAAACRDNERGNTRRASAPAIRCACCARSDCIRSGRKVELSQDKYLTASAAAEIAAAAAADALPETVVIVGLPVVPEYAAGLAPPEKGMNVQVFAASH